MDVKQLIEDVQNGVDPSQAVEGEVTEAKYNWGKVKPMNQQQFLAWFQKEGAPAFVSFALSNAGIDMVHADGGAQAAQKAAKSTLKFVEQWYMSAVNDYMKKRMSDLGM